MPIRQRITKGAQPMELRTRKVMWIFRYLYNYGRFLMIGRNDEPMQESWSVNALRAGLYYDDELAFVTDFMTEFPGPGRDLSEASASQRLKFMLKQLYDDGWIDRHKCLNHAEYMGEPQGWAYGYSLPAEFAWKIKTGRINPEYMARRYCGDGDADLALYPKK